MHCFPLLNAEKKIYSNRQQKTSLSYPTVSSRIHLHGSPLTIGGDDGGTERKSRMEGREKGAVVAVCRVIPGICYRESISSDLSFGWISLHTLPGYIGEDAGMTTARCGLVTYGSFLRFPPFKPNNMGYRSLLKCLLFPNFPP